MKTLVLDSSQIDTYLTCEQQWEYGYGEYITLSNEPEKALKMGTYGHKLLEIYYSNLYLGVSDAVECCRQFNPNGQIDLPKEELLLVWNIFDLYWKTYFNRDFEPLCTKKHSILIDPDTGLPFDVYTNSPLVEQGFSYELLHTKSELFVLEGRIDLLCMQAGINGFVDHKFQLRRRDLYEYDIQFRNYALATGCHMGTINYVRFHKNIEKDTFVRQPIMFSAQMLREWKQELIEIFFQIAKDSDNPHPFKRRSSCKGKYGYRCQYTRLCDEMNPAAKQAIKETQYKKKEEWKPW